MYGYVVPYKQELAMNNFVLYRAFYCGICKTTGKLYGQLPRFTTNYDITFLSVFLHDCLSQNVEFKEEGCVCNPFKKKAVVQINPLMEKLASLNILLAYYKAEDGIIDKEGLSKRIVKKALAKPYAKAKAQLEEADAIMNVRYKALRELEKGGADGIDLVSDCFASLLRDVAASVLGDDGDEAKLALCYNVGKFVYLADALDDIDEDYKKKRYNPFLKEFKNYKSRSQFLSDNKSDLEFILSTAVNRAIASFNNIKFTQSYELLQNIVYKGLREKVAEIFSSKKKLPKPRI